jgi:predicted ArsR family transcriptional regulator
VASPSITQGDLDARPDVTGAPGEVSGVAIVLLRSRLLSCSEVITMRPVKNRAALTGVTRARAGLLAALHDQPDPVGIEALATLTGRHPNTVREHLDRLIEAGLVVRYASLPRGRGRPAWLYQAVGPAPAPTDYPEVAAALAWATRETEGDHVSEAAATGRRWGRDLARDPRVGAGFTSAAHDADEARRHAVDVLTHLGFAPEADDAKERVRLTRCPLLQAAYANQAVVCSLHLGVVRGVLEEHDAAEERVALVPFAEPGACLLTFSAAAGDAAR